MPNPTPEEVEEAISGSFNSAWSAEILTRRIKELESALKNIADNLRDCEQLTGSQMAFKIQVAGDRARSVVEKEKIDE